ncbi:hypothetical protein AVDCRST_MAG92-4211 [uncultured Coleofasciculus sp.]|uniref:Uncharacterized protein n=1 Tax=uncultured Coleofasciculus sp. TaxID=1267456 RepID=A0A6J4JWK9_9CYAN|nr:hypothetical protein AVDCRST_MAG92-4211 [uncultured Coleofasciculus sp.]
MLPKFRSDSLPFGHKEVSKTSFSQQPIFNSTVYEHKFIVKTKNRFQHSALE